MPSDSKKREQQRKKDAQKKRNQKIATVTSKDDEKPTNGTTNGVATNGTAVELTEEGKLNDRSVFHEKKTLFFVQQQEQWNQLSL